MPSRFLPKMWHLRRKKQAHDHDIVSTSFEEIPLARCRDVPHSPYISILQYLVYYFFHRSTANPTTLKRILHLDEAPELHEAYIVGYMVARKNS